MNKYITLPAELVDKVVILLGKLEDVTAAHECASWGVFRNDPDCNYCKLVGDTKYLLWELGKWVK